MTDIKFNLVDTDLQPVADVSVALLDKLEKAVGWIVAPKGVRKERQEAIRYYINDIKGNSSLDTLTKAALISQASKTIKEYCNLNDIVSLAITQLNEDAKPLDVDEDWLSYFSEHAKNINRSDVKIVWGKILAGECNRNGSVPKVLLHTLSIMSKSDAETFEKLCCFIVKGSNSGKPVVEFLNLADRRSDFFEKYGLDFVALQNMDTIGLITLNSLGIDYGFNTEEEIITELVYYDTKIVFKTQLNSIPVGCVMFTKIGEILSKIIVGKKIDGFIDYLKDFYQSYNIDVEVMDS